jgi:type IV pilus assembly protein PilP
MKHKTRRGLSLSRAPRGGLNRARALVWLALALAGCEQAEESALRDWMAEQRRQFDAAAAVPPAPVAAPVQTFAVATAAARVPAGPIVGGDPFDPRRLAGPSQERMAASPDQPLAARPLSSLRMVGSLRRGDEVVALVQADQQVYQVPVGAVLGMDRARVLRISEDGITLRVALRGPQGEPLARTLILPLHGP